MDTLLSHFPHVPRQHFAPSGYPAGQEVFGSPQTRPGSHWLLSVHPPTCAGHGNSAVQQDPRYSQPKRLLSRHGTTRTTMQMTPAIVCFQYRITWIIFATRNLRTAPSYISAEYKQQKSVTEFTKFEFSELRRPLFFISWPPPVWFQRAWDWNRAGEKRIATGKKTKNYHWRHSRHAQMIEKQTIQAENTCIVHDMIFWKKVFIATLWFWITAQQKGTRYSLFKNDRFSFSVCLF